MIKPLLVGITAVVLSAASAVVRAQDISIKAGPAFSGVNSSGALPGQPTDRTGFDAGLGFAPSGSLGFGFDALYAQRGINNSTGSDAQQLTFIDVPLQLRFTLPLPLLHPFVEAGPQGSYNLKCTQGGVTCTAPPDKLTYSAVVGAGLNLPLVGLSLEGRYIYGLSNLDLSTVTSTASYKSRTFLILVGIGL